MIFLHDQFSVTRSLIYSGGCVASTLGRGQGAGIATLRATFFCVCVFTVLSFLSSPCRCSAIGALHTWALQYRPNGPTGGASTGFVSPYTRAFKRSISHRGTQLLNLLLEQFSPSLCVLDVCLSDDDDGDDDDDDDGDIKNNIYIYIYIYVHTKFTHSLSLVPKQIQRKSPR